jgi:hypothetical protein
VGGQVMEAVVDPHGWGVFVTADGVTTLVHMGIGTLSEARQELARMEPYWAEAHAEEVRREEATRWGNESADPWDAMANAIGLPAGSICWGTSWGWVIAREIP